MFRNLVFSLLVMFFCAAGSGAGEPAALIDDFEDGLAPGWEEKEFKGRTLYSVVSDRDGRSLRAESHDSASGLVFRRAYDLKDFPVLSWRWKVDGLVAKSDPRRKAGDDYPARVYVVFPHWFPPKTRSISYIWTSRFPVGEHIPNSYFANAVMVACRSGGEPVGQWVTEKRNVLEDYRRIFGEEPPPVGAIAIMTDTDNTGESVVAYYDDLKIESR